MEILLTIFVFILLIAPLSQLIHECGHAFAAKFFRANNISVYIGKGFILYEWNIFGIQWLIRWFIWLNAQTISEREKDFTNNEKIIISLAGPLMNGILAYVIILIDLYVYHHYLLQLTFVFNMWLFVMNCVPYKIGQMQTDGYTIYKIMNQSTS